MSNIGNNEKENGGYTLNGKQYYYDNDQGYSQVDSRINETADLFTKVFGWMFLGLLVTAATSFIAFHSDTLQDIIFGNIGVMLGLIVAQFVLVIVLSARVNKMNFSTALVSYLLYTIINGLTLSVIFLVYNIGTIYLAFGVTALTFGAISVFGAVTKKDLSGVGSIAIMALFGLIIGSVVNMFFASSMLDWVITYAGIIIFTALTAYDVQKIKNLSQSGVNNNNLAIIGALTLYLDFINLFLRILRVLGGRGNRN